MKNPHSQILKISLIACALSGCAIDHSVDSYGNSEVFVKNKTAVKFNLEIGRITNGNITTIGTTIAPMSSVRMWITGDISVSYNNKSMKIPYTCKYDFLEEICSLTLDSSSTASILK